MKRFVLGVAIDFTGQIPVPTMTEHSQGEWVKWEDVRNLEIAYKKIKLALQLIVDAGEDK